MTGRKGVYDRILSTVLTLCALVIAGIVIGREFGSSQPILAPAASPSLVPRWEEAMADARLQIRNVEAPVQVVEFLDLQCPYCREFHELLDSPEAGELRASVGLSMVHFPRRNHAQSRNAAVAAECAARQGALEPFVELALADQASFGVRSWNSFATEAGVRSIEEFEQCTNAPDQIVAQRIEAGLALGGELGVLGTPTIMVNGWLLPPGVPTLQELQRVVSELDAGREPF